MSTNDRCSVALRSGNGGGGGLAPSASTFCLLSAWVSPPESDFCRQQLSLFYLGFSAPSIDARQVSPADLVGSFSSSAEIRVDLQSILGSTAPLELADCRGPVSWPQPSKLQWLMATSWPQPHATVSLFSESLWFVRVVFWWSLHFSIHSSGSLVDSDVLQSHWVGSVAGVKCWQFT